MLDGVSHISETVSADGAGTALSRAAAKLGKWLSYIYFYDECNTAFLPPNLVGGAGGAGGYCASGESGTSHRPMLSGPVRFGCRWAGVQRSGLLVH